MADAVDMNDRNHKRQGDWLRDGLWKLPNGMYRFGANTYTLDENPEYPSEAARKSARLAALQYLDDVRANKDRLVPPTCPSCGYTYMTFGVAELSRHGICDTCYGFFFPPLLTEESYKPANLERHVKPTFELVEQLLAWGYPLGHSEQQILLDEIYRLRGR